MLNPGPWLEAEALSTTMVWVQVNVSGVAMTALGGAVLLLTVAVAVALQPLVGLVTVSVYKPAAVTLGLRVLAPLAI